MYSGGERERGRQGEEGEEEEEKGLEGEETRLEVVTRESR